MDVRFSNRPFRVKRFQTIHDCGVNVARGLALLSGLGTKALPSWVSKTRWNNLSGDLAVNVTAGSSGRTNSPFGRPCRQCDCRFKRTYELSGDLAVNVTAGSSGRTNSPHPSSREGHHSTARWSSSVLLVNVVRLSCGCDLSGPAEFGVVNPDAVHDHGQPARQRHDRPFHSALPGDLHRPGL